MTGQRERETVTLRVETMRVEAIRVEGLPVLVTPGTTPQRWWVESVRAFRERVSRPGYPCFFGHATLARDGVYGTFVEGGVEPLAAVLVEFLDLSRQHLDQRMVIAAFVAPDADARDERANADRFWTILRGLRALDPDEWPAGLPEDPDHPEWEFAFHGVPMFVFAGAPSYQRRASRNLGAGLVLMFQPRNVFRGIEADTPRGNRARTAIRERLTRWDTVAPHPDLGVYGDPANREWAQYFVSDEGPRLYPTCPLRTQSRPDPDERGE
ncbi:YqcI/YcgG family protein [Pseudonocardia sp. TRM90224]|uniref:YqcI/YcgG family protein n=1 Tax=Pseudonocardia sp. TRM90224 TaxID=2812678 RepID=UPI001E4ED269|nr:YqcI/YcgG family protein [Pseudonocardia sp. TRM90224]